MLWNVWKILSLDSSVYCHPYNVKSLDVDCPARPTPEYNRAASSRIYAWGIKAVRKHRNNPSPPAPRCPLSTDNSSKFEAHTPAQPRSRFHSGFFLPCELPHFPPSFWDRLVDALKILYIAVRFWEFSFALEVVPSLSNRYTAKEIEHSYTTTHLA